MACRWKMKFKAGPMVFQLQRTIRNLNNEAVFLAHCESLTGKDSQRLKASLIPSAKYERCQNDPLFRYVKDDFLLAAGAYVGLAPPGDAGSWQRECKVTSFKK